MTERALPAGFQHRWTDIGGLRIHDVATIDGSRPTVVLVPGIGLSHRVMLPIAELLAPHLAVRAPDPPGFGRSDKPPRPLDVPELADALAAWIEAAAIDRPALVGNSFGCQIIVELAARHPERVACAVLQGPTMDAAARSLPSQTRRWLRDLLQERPDPRARLRDYRDAGLRRVLATYRLALRHRVEEQLPRVTAPALVLRGPDDPIVSQTWAQTVAELLPAGQLVVTATGAHTLVDQVVETSLPFLKRHLSPASRDDGPVV
jgi:2-hydroxy-6-oxonona-2,4-dienedioate hydrolase